MRAASSSSFWTLNDSSASMRAASAASCAATSASMRAASSSSFWTINDSSSSMHAASAASCSLAASSFWTLNASSSSMRAASPSSSTFFVAFAASGTTFTSSASWGAVVVGIPSLPVDKGTPILCFMIVRLV